MNKKQFNLIKVTEFYPAINANPSTLNDSSATIYPVGISKSV